MTSQLPGVNIEDPTRGMWLWVALIGLGSIALSRAFACATPFAALATLAAFTLRPRHAVSLVTFVWAVNQAVGFGLLHYPHDATTIAWGAVIGIAALAGLAVAYGTTSLKLPRWAATAAALVGAYAAYELVLLAATWPLGSGTGAFTLPIVARIFAINAAALGLLLGVHRLAVASGWSVASRFHIAAAHTR